MAGTDRKIPSCVCLGGTIGVDVGCTIYDVRPSPCRDFQASWSDGNPNPDCDKARAAYGLIPIENYSEGDSVPDGHLVERTADFSIKDNRK
jgi:Fe-S-cluster containining protein